LKVGAAAVLSVDPITSQLLPLTSLHATMILQFEAL
jgi:hypothetical protein